MTTDYIGAEFISTEEYERVLKYDSGTLTEWANRISQFHWGVPFNIPIKCSNREEMGSFAYGCFLVNLMTNDQRILLSERLVKHNYYNPLMVEKILLHELCHWYCYNHFGKRHFVDGCTRFEEEIRRIGAVSQFDISSGLIKVIQHRPTNQVPVN